jgi:signal transduction histidine kinase
VSAVAEAWTGLASLGDGERLAAYAAHELRTPLAAQRALLEVALADSRADVAAWREVAERALQVCAEQERLLESCLALAQAGSGPRRWERVDLAVVAARALADHDPGGLEQVVALQPAWTVGDPDLLERLAANLLSNAIRHNVAGGSVGVATRREPGRAVLVVANSGPLIPRREVPGLSAPFRRLDSSAGGGLGLGLAIVEAVAEAHGASIGLRARAGGGLEIRLGFPAPRRAARLGSSR